MKIMGLIPARAASARCPGKNTADLGGKPLLVWTIEAAKLAGLDFLVSSDDAGILALTREHGARAVPRPANLCQEFSPMIDVVRHHWQAEGSDSAVILLQPTSPFRTAEDITAAIDLMVRTEADSVVSVTEAQRLDVYEIGHADRMRPMRESRGLWVANGAIYILSAAALARREDWFEVEQCYAYRMPAQRSLDIDLAKDLEVAREIVAARPGFIAAYPGDQP